MDTLLAQLGLPLVALFCYMCALFLLAVEKKDNSVADIAYGMGFAVIAWVGTFAYVAELALIPTLLTLMVTVWGARLSLRIYLKNKGKPEDFRYAKWRSEWKHFYARSFLQVFMLQGLIIFIISLPVLLVDEEVKCVGFACAGFAVWLVGLFFEARGDYELDKYLAQPESKGHIMTTGLWKYTRHPNYFGESTMWWGIWLVSLSSIPMLWFVTLLSPVLITFLLLKVSGVPLLEAKMSQHPEWSSYASKTNALFPWPPRSK